MEHTIETTTATGRTLTVQTYPLIGSAYLSITGRNGEYVNINVPLADLRAALGEEH